MDAIDCKNISNHVLSFAFIFLKFWQSIAERNRDMTRENLDNVFLKMVEMYEGQPERIQHFTKVHSYAAYIGRQEKLDEKTMFILETAAYTHDIGIKKAEELYHASNGRLQQELGPGEAEIMLKELHFPEDVIERVKYLIAHHHTYSNIQGIDLQILIEADFLVNLYEHSDESVASKVLEKIFKTASGTKLCKTMFRL